MFERPSLMDQPALQTFQPSLHIGDLLLLGLNVLFFAAAILLLRLVQQHGRLVLILHRVRLAVRLVGDEFGIGLAHFLRD